VLNLVKNIAAIALLLVFIISSSGFSLATHYCSGSKKTTQSIYTGISGKQTCCGGMSCSDAGNHTQSSSSGSISKSKCCKENITFYKIAAVYNNMSIKASFIFLSQSIIFHETRFQALSAQQDKLLSILNQQYFPPPLAGKQRVFFLHQLRIPAPSSVS
jgi:hypothetical protein